jgi:hypothetical protein
MDAKTFERRRLYERVAFLVREYCDVPPNLEGSATSPAERVERFLYVDILDVANSGKFALQNDPQSWGLSKIFGFGGLSLLFGSYITRRAIVKKERHSTAFGIVGIPIIVLGAVITFGTLIGVLG